MKRITKVNITSMRVHFQNVLKVSQFQKDFTEFSFDPNSEQK